MRFEHISGKSSAKGVCTDFSIPSPIPSAPPVAPARVFSPITPNSDAEPDKIQKSMASGQADVEDDIACAQPFAPRVAHFLDRAAFDANGVIIILRKKCGQKLPSAHRLDEMENVADKHVESVLCCFAGCPWHCAGSTKTLVKRRSQAGIWITYPVLHFY